MTAPDLLGDLTRLGIQLEECQGQIRFTPASRMTATLMKHLRLLKPEILMLLRQSAATPAVACESNANSVYVYGIRLSSVENRYSVDVDTACESADAHPTFSPRVAPEAEVLAKGAHSNTVDCSEVLADWPAPPCPACNSLEHWEDLSGRWRCLRCDPPAASRRLRELAERIRSRNRR